jgi:phosphatidylglycerophosphate synthase
LATKVAGLSLLTRTLLTAQQAGIQQFVVVASDSQQTLLRAQLDGETRRRDRVGWLEPTGDLRVEAAYALVVSPLIVLEAAALRGWLERVAAGGGVTTTDGGGIGPLVVEAELLPPSIEAAHQGQSDLMQFLENLDGGRRLVHVPWQGAARLSVRSPGEVPAVERAMLAALRSPDDGPVLDRYLNRTVSALLTRGALRSRVTPNQVTAASLLTGLTGAWLLGGGGNSRSLWGLILFQLSVILDHVDGEVARVKIQFSRLGKWLDNFSDHAVDLAVIVFLTWRVAAGQAAGDFIMLGLAAGLGVTGAFLVVFGWTMSGRPREVRKTATARLLARILATLANRDGFSLALWVTLLLGRAEWFVWVLALGANAYWVAWIFSYGVPPTPLLLNLVPECDRDRNSG